MPIKLGELIKQLEARPADHPVVFDFGGLVPNAVDSYRGDYSHLALGHGEWNESGAFATVGDLLAELKKAVGGSFQGYKGGEFRMDEDTPVWVANYGECHDTAVTGLADCGWRTVIATAFEDY